MNLVGKILTVFVFVAALTFMCFTVAVYATHKNWQHEIDNPNGGYKARLVSARDLTTRLKNEKANLETELAQVKEAKKEALTKAEGRYDTLKGEYESKSKECDAKTEEARVASAAVKIAHTEVAALRTEVTRLRANILAAQQARDGYFDQVVKLTDDIHQKVNELKRLKERQKELAEIAAERGSVLQLFGLVGIRARYLAVPPALDGKVQGIAEGGLVEISLGSDEGLLQGHKLFVVRRGGGGAKFVGTIEVMRTDFDKAACKIVQSHQAVQPGDLVYTVLPGQVRVHKKQPARG
ncbi:MAG: hypothetical protein HQ567_28225 [Candidatus Nealsonbacteria bacterium]|nr:hypothetical protein [Candidatus Nealsonbacteria bacterium]